VDDLTAIAEGLRDVRRDLNLISEQTQQLQLHSNQLQVGLEGVKQELGSLLQLCSSPACQLLAAEYDPSQLSSRPSSDRPSHDVEQLTDRSTERDLANPGAG